jgi:hypothetical protein
VPDDPLSQLERGAARSPRRPAPGRPRLDPLSELERAPGPAGSFLHGLLGTPVGRAALGAAAQALGAHVGVDVAASLRSGGLVLLPEPPKRSRKRR